MEGSPQLLLGPGPQNERLLSAVGSESGSVKGRPVPGPRDEEEEGQVLSTAGR